MSGSLRSATQPRLRAGAPAGKVRRDVKHRPFGGKVPARRLEGWQTSCGVLLLGCGHQEHPGVLCVSDRGLGIQTEHRGQVTSRSPPAPAKSACTARATRSAPSRCPGAPGTWSRPGWTSAAATPAPPGTGSVARSPSPASPRSSLPPAPASPACAPIAAATPSARASKGDADPAQVQALLGHASVDTAAVLPRRISRERRRHRAHLRQLTGRSRRAAAGPAKSMISYLAAGRAFLAYRSSRPQGPVPGLWRRAG